MIKRCIVRVRPVVVGVWFFVIRLWHLVVWFFIIGRRLFMIYRWFHIIIFIVFRIRFLIMFH